METLNREEWLNQLQSVQAGISSKEVVEQSNCFVFHHGTVFTYNDEAACSCDSMCSISGAVQALPLLEILKKLKEEEVKIEVGEGELVIYGKKKKVGIRMERDILLPVDEAHPGDLTWKELNPDFIEALSIVVPCCGKDESSFSMTCVHVHPKYVEACDNFQAIRYSVSIGIKSPVLLRKESIKHIRELGMTEYGETDNWFHFKNPHGLIFSCRRYIESFPEMDSIYEVEGDSVVLPKSIISAAENAYLFAKDNTKDKVVVVTLRPGKVKIVGEGISGWYEEIKKSTYQGESFSFTIDPKLLKSLVEKHNEFIISHNRIKVDGGKFVYITALGEAND